MIWTKDFLMVSMALNQKGIVLGQLPSFGCVFERLELGVRWGMIGPTPARLYMDLQNGSNYSGFWVLFCLSVGSFLNGANNITQANKYVSIPHKTALEP